MIDDALKHVQQLEIPKMYTLIPLLSAKRKKINISCDASTKAVGAVSYRRLTCADCHSEVGSFLA